MKFQGVEEATKSGWSFDVRASGSVAAGTFGEFGRTDIWIQRHAHVKAYTDLPETFGMIVTAEPYFAVTQPGNMVVIESASVGGGGEIIDARYEW